MEGTDVPNIDAYSQAGGPFVAFSREVAVTVDDGALSIEVVFGVNNPMLSGLEILLLAPHLAHAVPGGPYSAVDIDDDGYAIVSVDGGQSHTHAAGEKVVTFEWTVGGTTLGSTEVAELLLPLGAHELRLHIVDSGGHESFASTRVDVLGSEYPSISSIFPQTGRLLGGDLVLIMGSGFSNVTSVHFGDFKVSAFHVVQDNLISLKSPESSHAVPVSVEVETVVGVSNPGLFTYIGDMPVSFHIGELVQVNNPTSVAFGPDRKLYVGTSDGALVDRATKHQPEYLIL